MRAKQIEVRGCCMGIPFGCGSILLLVLAALFVQNPPSTTFLLTAVAWVMVALATAVGILIAVEWLLENRKRPVTARGLPPGSETPCP
jgi:hypothetical protein